MAFDMPLYGRTAIESVKETLKREFGWSDDSNSTKRKRTLTDTYTGSGETASKIGASDLGSTYPSKRQRIDDPAGSSQGAGLYGTPLSHEELQQLVGQVDQQVKDSGALHPNDDVAGSEEETELDSPGPSLAELSRASEDEKVVEGPSEDEDDNLDEDSSANEESAKAKDDRTKVDRPTTPSLDRPSPPRLRFAQLTPRSKRRRIEEICRNGTPIHEPGKPPPKPLSSKEIRAKLRPRCNICEKIIASSHHLHALSSMWRLQYLSWECGGRGHVP